MANYYVAIFSLKKRWLRRHPNAAKLRIRIITKSQKEKFEAGATPRDIFSKGGKKFKRWVETDGLRPAPTMGEAWKEAYAWKGELKKNRRTADLKDQGGHRIYAFEMTSSVWNVPSFKKANYALDDKYRDRPCFYVGMTSKTAKERYKTHQDKNHPASTRWAGKHFLDPYKNAYQKELLISYSEETGKKWKNLKESEAHWGELELTQWLRKHGYPAYSA